MSFVIPAHFAEPSLKAAKNTVKVYNFHAKNMNTGYLPQRLEEELDKQREEKNRANAVVNAQSVRRKLKRLRNAALTKTSFLQLPQPERRPGDPDIGRLLCGQGLDPATNRKIIKFMKGKLGMDKQAVQYDNLGKNTSPATQGGSIDAPMPQTNYAKNTLENEYAERLNKKQLAEMNRLRQQQDQNGSNQSSTSTTSSDGTTTTTTTSGLSNSGLMSALSVGSVM